MVLTARISPHDPPAQEQVEDLFESSLGALFSDDVINLHGDAEHALRYTSPHLPRPLILRLSNPDGYREQALFSHHLWNAALLMAEFVERDSLDIGEKGSVEETVYKTGFDVRGRKTLELGAGSGLPSMMGALVGATEAVVTDYPASSLLDVLRGNVARNVVDANSVGGMAGRAHVEGHMWGRFGEEDGGQGDGEDGGKGEEEEFDDGGFSSANRHAFDRVLAADCLWMPWQHENLRRSISWFLKNNATNTTTASTTATAASDTTTECMASCDARAYVIGGLHTKREGMRDFFDADALARNNLAVEAIWERDCDGVERKWAYDRGSEDIVGSKRWLVVGVLKRV